MASKPKSKDKKREARFKATSSNPLIQPYLQGINSLANGDAVIGKGLLGGAQLGTELFGPGSLGRLDENVLGDPNVARALELTKYAAENDSQELKDAVAAGRKAIDVADPNSSVNLDTLRKLQVLTSLSPDQRAALDIARNRAETAGNLTDLENELLNLRRGNLGGLGKAELTALAEGGGYDAQGNLVPGRSAINRAAQSALAGLQANNLVSGGPSGRATLIQARPIVQNVADSTASLQRKLILDEYNSKVAAQDALAGDLTAVNKGVNDRIDTSSQNYAAGANTAQQVLNTGASNLSNFVTGTNQNYINATGNFGTIANNADVSRANRLQRFIDTTGNIRNETLYRQTYNLDQLSREKAGFSSTLFGGGAFAAEQAGRKDANTIAQKQLDAAKSFNIGGSSRSSGSTWGTSNNGQSTADSFDVAA